MEIKKIYFDMDGVLSDFDRGIEELCHMPPRNQEYTSEAQDDLLWSRVREIPHFFGQLETMPGAEEMFRRIYAVYGDKCEILTGIPKECRGIVDAAADKKAWIARRFTNEIVVNTVHKVEKKNFCLGPGYILIDDLAPTIRDWNARGGNGILHTSIEETLRQLEEIEKA